jgi:hypothetical protein
MKNHALHWDPEPTRLDAFIAQRKRLTQSPRASLASASATL